MDASQVSLVKTILNVSTPSDQGVSFTRDEILKGLVQEVKPDGTVIMQIKGQLIEAVTEVKVEAGQQLFLKVDDFRDGKTYLKVLTPEGMENIEKANLSANLAGMGISGREENIAMARKLLEYNLPVTANNLNEMARGVKLLGEASARNLEMVAFTISRGLPVNQATLKALVQYTLPGSNLAKLVQAVLQGLSELGQREEVVLPSMKTSVTPASQPANIVQPSSEGETLSSKPISTNLAVSPANPGVSASEGESGRIPTQAAVVPAPVMSEKIISNQANSSQSLIPDSTRQSPGSNQAGIVTGAQLEGESPAPLSAGTVSPTETDKDNTGQQLTQLNRSTGTSPTPVAEKAGTPQTQVSSALPAGEEGPGTVNQRGITPTGLPNSARPPGSTVQAGVMTAALLEGESPTPLSTGSVSPQNTPALSSPVLATKTASQAGTFADTLGKSGATGGAQVAFNQDEPQLNSIKTTVNGTQTLLANQVVDPDIDAKTGQPDSKAQDAEKAPVVNRSVNLNDNTKEIGRGLVTTPLVMDESAERGGAPAKTMSPGMGIAGDRLPEQLNLLRSLLDWVQVDGRDAPEAIKAKLENIVATDKDLIRGLMLLEDLMKSEAGQVKGSMIHDLLQRVDSLEKELSGQKMFNYLSRTAADNQFNYYYFSFPVQVGSELHQCQLRINKDGGRDLKSQDSFSFAVSLDTSKMGLVLFHVTWRKNRSLAVQGVVQSQKVADYLKRNLDELLQKLQGLGYTVQNLGLKVSKEELDQSLKLQVEEAPLNIRPLGIDIKV